MEIAKLFVSLALESGEYVKGLTNVSGQTKAISAQVDKTIGGMKNQLKTVGQNAVDFGKKFQSALSNVATALLPVGVAMGAVGLAAKAMWDSLNRGAELELTRSRFENLTESIGTTADTMLGKMREATRGMISDAELMASGSDIISLGLAKTEDQAVRLASVVGQLGWDMQQVILTFANNSTMRLDALGLSVEAVTTRAKELEAAGMSMDAAFDLAVIEEGEKKLELLGSAADTTEGRIRILETAWANAVDAFNEEFASGLVEQLAAVTDSIELVSGASTAAATGAAAVLSKIVGHAIFTDATFRSLIMLGAREMENAQAEEAARISHLAATEAELVAHLAAVAAEQEQVEQRSRQMSDALKDASISTEWLDFAMAENARATEAAGEAIIDYAIDTSIWGDNAEIARVKALEFGAAMGYDAEQAQLAAEAVEAYNAAFQGVIQSGDYTKPLPGSDEPLVTPVHTVSSTMGGLTAEQSELVSRYRGEIEKLQTSVYNLTNGINTYGMDQEKVNERIADAQAEIAHYEALMAPLVGIVGETTTAHQGMAVNIKAAEQAIFDQLVQMGAAPELITAYGVAIGVMSQDQADAALAAALLQIKIGELAEEMNLAIKEGTKSVQEIVAEGRESLLEYAEELTATGENLPEALAEGVTGNEQVAIDAITETANEIIRAANATFEIHSPSQVFADIGDNLGVSLTDGFSDAIDNARSTLEGIGQRVIDGVKAGIETAKASLAGIVQGVADSIPAWLKAALGIASPAAELIPVGVAITEGIIEGIRVRAAGADDEIVDIIKEMLDSARTFVSAGAGFGQIFTNQAITPIQKQIQLLSEQADIMDMVFMQYASHLGLEWGADNFWIELHRMSRSGTAEQQYLAAQMLSLYDQRQDALQQMTAAQSELVKQEEKLLRLEQARADLDFLKQQYELIKLIQENNLDTSILDGLTTGVNADAEAWMNAMIEATQAMIAAVEDELGIHSPSRWAVGVMHNVFDTMAETAERDAQALRNSMSRALEVGLAPATTTPVTTAAQTVDNSRRSVNYGGIHIHGETRYRSPLDVLQEQLV